MVNNVIPSTVGPLAASTVVIPVAGSSDAVAPVISQPSLRLDVDDKLDHLANAVSAINIRLGVLGNEVEELKDKSNSSRVWEDVLNLSRVSVG